MKITLYVDDSNDDREAPKKLALRLLTSAFDLDAGETVLDRFYHLVTKYGLQRLVAEEFAVRAIREEDEIEITKEDGEELAGRAREYLRQASLPEQR